MSDDFRGANIKLLHCSARKKNAETEMSSNGAGKSVVTSLKRDCPAVHSRSWRQQPEKLGCRP